MKVFPYLRLCKTSDQWVGAMLSQGYNLNNLGRDLDEATYQMSNVWCLLVLAKKILKNANRSLLKIPFAKWSKSAERYKFYKLHWTHVPNAAHQAQWPFALWFRRRRILKDFYYMLVWQQFWSCIQDLAKKHSAYKLRLHVKFGFYWPSGF